MKYDFLQKFVFALGMLGVLAVFVYGILPALSAARQIERRTDFPTESAVEYGTPWTGSGVEGPRRDIEKMQFDEAEDERKKRGELKIEAGDVMEELDFYFKQDAAYERARDRLERQINYISLIKTHDDRRKKLIDALANIEEVIKDAAKNTKDVSCFIKRLHDKTSAVKSPELMTSYQCN